MKNFTIDLYEYFNVERNGNLGGYLTCYLHENTREVSTARLYPAMLVLPGGAYVICSDREAEPVAVSYFAKGFNAFVLNYSCVPSRFPSQLIEGAMAMAYIRREAEASCTDKSHVAAVGFSAGGHLCGSITTMYSYSEISAVTNILPEEVRPDASILCYPVVCSKYGDATFKNLSDGKEEILSRISIEKLVDSNTPPLFVWTTANDGLVNSMHSIEIAAAAKQNGVPFNLHIFESGQHGLSLASADVYPNAGVPNFTSGTEKWFALSVKWLKDRGFNYTV